MPDNIEYYDSIAADYDKILQQDKINNELRRTVARKFSEVVEPGLVLDFGGGTGSDLPWLTGAGYTVIFLEPSSKMRDIALKNNEPLLVNQHVHFLRDDETKIENWSEHPPFGPVNGVLCNFAVLNNIRDLKATFERLAKTIRKGGSLIALVLRAGFKRFVTTNISQAVRKLFTRQPFVMRTRYHGNQQTVYLHTISEIQKDSSSYFGLTDVSPIEDSEFILLHLTRL